MQKNNIFSKKSQKICKFEIFFVTLQPIRSVVRISGRFMCVRNCDESRINKQNYTIIQIV